MPLFTSLYITQPSSAPRSFFLRYVTICSMPNPSRSVLLYENVIFLTNIPSLFDPQNKMEEADGCWLGTFGRGGKLRSRTENDSDEPVLGSLPPSGRRPTI